MFCLTLLAVPQGDSSPWLTFVPPSDNTTQPVPQQDRFSGCDQTNNQFFASHGAFMIWGYSGICSYFQRITTETPSLGKSGTCYWGALPFVIATFVKNGGKMPGLLCWDVLIYWDSRHSWFVWILFSMKFYVFTTSSYPKTQWFKTNIKRKKRWLSS